MKKKFLDLLAKKSLRKTALVAKADKCEDVAELRSINSDMDDLNAEIAELRALIDGMPDDVANPAGLDENGQSERTRAVNGAAIPAIVASGIKTPESRSENPLASLEYRNAFMGYMKNGQLDAEFRNDTFTSTTDGSAIVPTTIINDIIKKIETYGNLYARVRKTNVAAGMSIPILSLKPVASWIGEGTGSERLKVTANTNISFNYYGLECKIAQSLILNLVSLPVFENSLITLISEAMIKAIDTAILKGTGDGQPLGVLVDTRVVAGQKITITPADFAKWAEWKKQVFAKIPLSYDGGALIMAKGTFDGYIDGMVDTTGQPIARVTYGIDGTIAYRFGGKEVILVEDDLIKPFDTATGNATTGDVVAVYINLKDYVINTNMQMSMLRYTDNDLNQIVDKAIMVVDGKLADALGVIVIKKGVDTVSV
jgi:HK97 family phage major capsid protein